MKKTIATLCMILFFIAISAMNANASIEQSADIICAPAYDTDLVEKTVTFTANYLVTGYDPYTIEWSTDDGSGISGTGDTLNVSYDSAGTKNVFVDVMSGETSVAKASCSVSIKNISDLAPISASCDADVGTATVDQTVTWSSSIGGGMGPYVVSWGGTDALSGSGTSVSKAYTASGDKTASLLSIASRYSEINDTVSDIACAHPVTVYGDEIEFPNLYASCSASDKKVKIGELVSWTASTTGGSGINILNGLGMRISLVHPLRPLRHTNLKEIKTQLLQFQQAMGKQPLFLALLK